MADQQPQQTFDVNLDGLDTSEDSQEGNMPTPPAPTFTQEDVNRMIARERQKVRKEVADYAQLKADSDELKRLRASAQSVEERLREEASVLKRERDSFAARAQTTMVTAAIAAEAARQGAADPDDVANLLDRSELVVSDEGVEGVREAVELLLAKKRYLVGGRRRSSSEFRGAERTESSQITRSQIRAWAHGEDGGFTPERMKLIEEAQRAGTIDTTR